MMQETARQSLTVAIIGAGLLGRRLALASARAGVHVFLEDVMPVDLQHAQEALRRELGAEIEGDRRRIEFVGTIEDAVRQADLVIDCVPDELESKLEILWLLDRMAPPRTVLATPTKSQSIADLAACTYRPDKCIAIAAKPTELAADPEGKIVLESAPQTSRETLDLVRKFWEGLGFTVCSH